MSNKIVCRLLLLCLFNMWMVSPIIAQQENKPSQPDIENYLDVVQSKSKTYSYKLDKKSLKYLIKLQRIEKKLQRKFSRIDSVAEKEIFLENPLPYEQYISNLRNNVQANYPDIEYSPYLDSISTSLKFFISNHDLYNQKALKQTHQALSSVDKLQMSLRQSDHISKMIQGRKELLKKKMAQFPLNKPLKNINKQIVYYNQQINDYKGLINDRKKAEVKALEMLSKVPAFKNFMKNNSMLSLMFPGQQSGNLNLSLQGLQTRKGMEDLLKERFGGVGIDITKLNQKLLENKESQVGKIKEKLIQVQYNSDLEDKKNFRPNSQKTKSIFRRLEFGWNIQTQKSNHYIPSIADLGLSLGYKLKESSVIGIGFSYKMGLGSEIRKVKVSHEGIALRSFIDVKYKYNFWISGGAEFNFLSSFTRLNSLQEYSQWQRSALIGLTKKYKASKRFQGKVQVLYDFLYKEHTIQSQPIIFRAGYSF